MTVNIDKLKRMAPSNEWHGVKSLEEAIANPVPGQDTHLPR